MSKKIWFGLAISLLVAALLSPFASPLPDGLERVAEDHSFLQIAEGQEVISSPIPDYLIPGLQNEMLATALAGVVGVLTTYVGLTLLLKLLVKQGKTST
ncbi:PDGLE domain-containing protein [Desulforamulus ferrireducens]|uniref:PDGLE domain-containing protein n=1 Tax=Desulforamulus ferrireducens TaxID=1833852 RepID=A0A1S6IYZ0_9FIRM|nr:PDGLE domain-containing protein [Desulforamulus ferrireducens]AQS59980.1 hypothetical protein B0537_13390 [Desulforamulus ferrireducens]